MAMAGSATAVKKTFEFDIPMELINFMRKFGGNENDAQKVIERIISDGVANHINQTLEDLQRVATATRDLNVGLREGRRIEETTIQY
ncbi:MAG: hypothetical protein ABIH52_02330 [Candidatus Aenigmatarchaeota archaeon]|nr:hypothetical protein [Nanoarchaeota archaeon]